MRASLGVTGVMVLSLVSDVAFAMSVEEAYQLIPHRRTVFEVRAATMDQEARDYLQQFFHVVDLAIRERVQLMRQLRMPPTTPSSPDQYDSVLSQLKTMPVPSKLQPVHQLVVEAINEQRMFLMKWQQSLRTTGNSQRGREPSLAQDPLVSSASQKLRQAYQELMRLFPQEGPHNKDAFYDYLCALDFM